ncbi:MAG: DNA polymerase III subunit gamma/tau [Thermomicrobiales bacterium]
MSDGSLFSLSGPGLDPAAEPVIPSSITGSSTAPSQSLYRKYRPQSFDEDDLFGQEHVVNTLRNAIALGRLAHAYLFCGPRGTGKTTTARLLAKAVNCLDPDPYQRPCNVCAACVAINKGATTDVIEIDAASNRGIDDIRDLRERVKYAPTQLRTKFYIIDEAHQITGAAANAFLKTLEEPPAHTKFVLATTDPEELLQTIVSRCQRFDFRRINLDAMQACIRKVAREERIEIADDAVLAIARHATGSLRDALGLLDQVAVYRDDAASETTTVTLDLVRTVLGVSRNDRVEAIVTALADRDAAAGLATIASAVESGEDMRQLARQLLAYLRMLLIQRAGGSSDADDAARALADRFQIHELADLVRGFAELDTKVKHATLAQLPLELAIVDGALRDQRPVATAVRAAPAAPDDVRSASPREMPRDTAPRYPEPDRNPFDDDLGAPPPPPYEGELLTERPNRPSLRDRVRGATSAPAQTPAPAPSGPTEPRPARPRPESRPQRSANDEAGAPARYGAAPRNGTADPEPATYRPSAPEPAPVVTAPSGSMAGVDIETIVEQWVQIRNDVKAVNRRTEALLQQVDPAGVAGDTLVLVSPYEFHRNKVNSDEARAIVEDVIQRRLNRRLTVTCVTREEAQAMIAKRAPSATPTPIAEPAAPPVSPSPTPAPERNTKPPVTAESASPVNAEPARPASAASDEPLATRPDDAKTPFDPELDEKRLNAVRNIFDAEDIDEDTEFI